LLCRLSGILCAVMSAFLFAMRRLQCWGIRGGGQRSCEICQHIVWCAVVANEYEWCCPATNKQLTVIYALAPLPPPLGGGIKQWYCLTSVWRLSVCRVYRA